MDPRGRKGNYSTKEDLLKFYHISSGEDTDDEEEQSASDEDGDDNDEVDGKSNEVSEAVDTEDNLVHDGIVLAKGREDSIMSAERKESESVLDEDDKDEKENENGLIKGMISL